MKDSVDQINPRKTWLSLLAKAPSGRVAELLGQTMPEPQFSWLRSPEVGSVMVRGRAGGAGSPFNLGEMTVTRCALSLATGEIGHGYVQGRCKEDARAAALVDALMQTDQAEYVRAKVLGPLQQEETARRLSRAGKAAATKVEFFTMARGED
jgi:alpha-D-ribose 1-methylphosphonate 5-triphosphate synthase subunit PhnG